MRVAANIQIDAPLETVFKVFTDLDNLEENVEGIMEVEILKQPSQMAVGTKWKETRLFYNKEATEVMWVTELNHNKNYVVEAESGGTHYRSEYTFEQLSDAVRVSVVFVGKPLTLAAKILGVLFFFITKTLEKTLYQDMVDLKRVCEKSK